MLGLGEHAAREIPLGQVSRRSSTLPKTATVEAEPPDQLGSITMIGNLRDYKAPKIGEHSYFTYQVQGYDVLDPHHTTR